MPIRPVGDIVEMNYEELMKPTAAEEEKVEDGSQPLFNYDTAKDDRAKQEALLERFELIRKRKLNITQDKSELKVAVIFNPYVTGNRVAEIENLFTEYNIATEFFMCEQNLDPYRHALDINLDNFSALVAVGGDGTLNQMVNGMLARDDGKRLPVGIIPTGYANDFARSLGLTSEMTLSAIQGIAKGEAIAVDTTRVLIDNETEGTLPLSDKRLSLCRHMLSSTSLSMPAKIGSGADSMKGWCGSTAFSLSTYF